MDYNPNQYNFSVSTNFDRTFFPSNCSYFFKTRARKWDGHESQRNDEILQFTLKNNQLNCIYRPPKPLNSNKKKMIGNYWFPRENCGTFPSKHTHFNFQENTIFSNKKRSFSNCFPPLLLPVNAFSTHLLYFISSSKPYMFLFFRGKKRTPRRAYTPLPAQHDLLEENCKYL